MQRVVFLLCISCFALAAMSDAQAEERKKSTLRLLFLGELDTPRTRDFQSFLEGRFSSVRVADRWKLDRSILGETDVVVLDWPQQDGVSKWMLAGDKTVPAKSPLGKRGEWTLPTVLLGSAGLNTAWAWDVKGGFG